MKRVFAILLVLCTVFGSALTTPAMAEEELIYSVILPSYEANSGPAYETLANYTNMTTLRKHLDQNLQACNASFEVYSYGIPEERLNELVHYMFKEIPESFHISGLSYSLKQGKINKLYPTYNMTKSQYDVALGQCREIAQNMTSGLEGLSDADKALVLHDRLAVHNEYDLSLNAPYTGEMYGALVNRTSVCEGYAMAYSYLLDMVGIRNYYVTSDLLNHGWNMVYIDGVKYHVDVTWDDPVYDEMGYVRHVNFLRSTQGMLDTGHYKNNSYDFDSSATDTRYDNAYWQNSQTAVQAVDGALYYLDTHDYSVTNLVQVKNGQQKVLADVSANFPSAYGYFSTGWQRLSSDGQDLLYSAGNKVYRYCLNSGTIEVVWELAIPSDHSVFGFTYENGTLIAVPLDYPSFGADTNHTARVTKAYTPHVHQGAVTRGDVDGSGTADMDDAIHLLYYINFPEYYSVNQTVDFDGSGAMDMDDAIYLLYHVNFPSAYPLH